MGHFFFGVIVGLLFSSLLYIVFLAVGFPKQQRWGLKGFLAEFIFVVAVTVIALFVWAPPDLEWVGRLLIPVKQIQILLGIGTGVFIRVWLTNAILLYLYPQPASDREISVEPTAESEAAKQSPPQRNSGPKAQDLAIGFLTIVLVAVLLPYLENMVKQAASIKLGTVEITVRSEQKSGYLSILSVSRDKLNSGFLSVMNPKRLRELQASDLRRYGDPKLRAKMERENKEFASLYQEVLFPFAQCISVLFNQGWDVGTLKTDARVLATDLLVIANSNAKHTNASGNIKKMMLTAKRVMTKWSAVDPGCRGIQVGLPPVGPQARDSFMFYWFTSYFLSFLDDRLSAIQVLERVGDRFRENELNWGNLLGVLYYEEDPTLTKTIEYNELALTIAKDGLGSIKSRISSGSLSCPASKTATQAAQDACFDYRRYDKARRNLENQTAFYIAQSGRSDLARARLLAKEVLRETLADRQSSKQDQWAALDTYAYVEMGASARSAAPDTKIIACAEKTFKLLTDQAAKEFTGVMARPNTKDFRTNFLLSRYQVEAFASHRTLAANLLALLREGECSERDKEYKDMQKGEL